MLAFMPQSPPLSVHAPATSDTMSLAIMSSAAPMACGQVAVPALLPPSPAPSKRPKLSLNTTSIPSSAFGKASTSLRLETLSATSPTVRNTFSNAHERLSGHLKPQARFAKPTLAPLATSAATSSQQSLQSATQNSPSTTSSTSTSSAISVGEIFTAPERIPYKISYNVTSILSNSPLPRRRTRRMPSTQSKPMFPATKQVSFRTPLTEDIKTSTYTMKHSDIESSTSTISTLELSPTDKMAKANESADTSSDEDKKHEADQSTPSPRTGDKRESSDEEDSDTCPATPVAGRKKRHRQWVWTLGPVTSSKAQETTEVAIRVDEKDHDSS